MQKLLIYIAAITAMLMLMAAAMRLAVNTHEFMQQCGDAGFADCVGKLVRWVSLPKA